MKVLTPAIQKGGTGKTAISVQLAYYLHMVKGLRILVLDLDHQGNSSKALKTGAVATLSATPASNLFKSRISRVESTDFLLIAADAPELRALEQNPDKHNEYATHLKASLNAIGDQFDLCIIDVNPNPDIRQLAALVVSNFVVSPVQLAQESIDGIGDMLNDPAIGVRRIQATINPRLKLLGLLPNLVEPTPFQKQNFVDLAKQYGQLLIPMEHGYAAIKKSTAVFEAQAAGVPIWGLGKTSSREAWKSIRPVFDKLIELMELNVATVPESEQKPMVMEH